MAQIKDALKKHQYVLIAALVFAIPTISTAAQLNTVVGVETVEQNELFRVDLLLENNTVPINAVSAKVNIPTEFFEFHSFEFNDSIISLWVQDPVYEPSRERVSLEGITLNENGFRGRSGKIVSIYLKGVSSGTPTIDLMSGLVLAHDGQGTNVLEGMNGASIVITDGKGYANRQGEYIENNSLQDLSVDISKSNPQNSLFDIETNPVESEGFISAAQSKIRENWSIYVLALIGWIMLFAYYVFQHVKDAGRKVSIKKLLRKDAHKLGASSKKLKMAHKAVEAEINRLAKRSSKNLTTKAEERTLSRLLTLKGRMELQE